MQKVNLLKNLFLIFTIILLLSACAARKEKTLFNASTDIVTDTIKQVYVVNDQGLGDLYYKIKVNDILAVRNVQNKEFGSTGAIGASSGGSSANVTSYPVDNDGKVNLPAIGKIAVAGLTRKEATAKLQAIYAEKQLVDPIIEVTIVNVKVTLLGEFMKQGNFLLERDNTSLIDILGEAGGITKTADPKTLKIIRGERSNPEIIYVNLNDINSLASKKLILQNNDIIVLQPTKSSVLGEKLQSYNNIIQPLLVVINLAVLIFTFTR
ncbi:MAG: polysaccharide biosynthesis/export family protein [Pedobacter sp.]|jgi:polysaccharide export outer membrane protein|uniref:polysaccharide biosynthesis/export family protein n=1 Tax=Pedobacter sp. TaxID=1411316 RepID=UPI0035696791